MGYTVHFPDPHADDDGIRLTLKDLADDQPAKKPKRKPRNWKPYKRIVRILFIGSAIVCAVGVACLLAAVWMFGQLCGAGSAGIRGLRANQRSDRD